MQFTHPDGVQPWGNFLLRKSENIRVAGLGSLNRLTDDLLMNVISLLDATSLCRLKLTSKALYCWGNHDDLWRQLTLEEFEGDFVFEASWQQTYLTRRGLQAACAVTPEIGQPTGQACKNGAKRQKRSKSAEKPRNGLVVRGFFSDLLYQPWFCAHVEMRDEWMAVENVERRSGLTANQFRLQYEIPNRPVIITDAVTTWPAVERWTDEYLLEAFRGHSVIVGGYRMEFAKYLAYMQRCSDEMPLYLFDKKFVDKAPQLGQDYMVPEVFSEDLLSVLGESRPDYRWLIIGPTRSGSSFHKDPNETSAWNGVVRGSKKWVMFPPHVIPPGVHPSEDGADVATPTSLMEWFLNFYEACSECDVAPCECIVRTGELLFVPRGWWHLAINLEDSVAVTQNYVSSVNLPHVLQHLSTRSTELVSGCAWEERGQLHDNFVAALQASRPQLIQQVEADRAEKAKRKQTCGTMGSLFGKKSTAESDHSGVDDCNLVDADQKRFCFNFSFSR